MYVCQEVRLQPLIGWDTVHHYGLSCMHKVHQAGTESLCLTITTIRNCGNLCIMGKPLTCLFLAHLPHQCTFARVKHCLTGANMYWCWAPPQQYVCIIKFLPLDIVIFASNTALSIQFCTALWDSSACGWIIPAAPITGKM